MAASKPKTATKTKARAPLDRLREICLTMPGAVEKLSHGEPTWFTGPKGKVFVMFDDHHHGAAHVSAYIATPMELRDELLAAAPDRYWIPPYVGSKGWVAVYLDGGPAALEPDWAVIACLVREGFANVGAPTRRARRR